MNNNPERIAEFQSEIEQMKVKAAGGENETRLLIVGIALGVAGLALAIFGGIMVQNDANEFNQRAYMATGSYIGLALLIAGAALFVRYSLARFMRFWLIRMVHEGRANTDRIVDAIDRAAGIDPGPR